MTKLRGTKRRHTEICRLRGWSRHGCVLSALAVARKSAISRASCQALPGSHCGAEQVWPLTWWGLQCSGLVRGTSGRDVRTGSTIDSSPAPDSLFPHLKPTKGQENSVWTRSAMNPHGLSPEAQGQGTSLGGGSAAAPLPQPCRVGGLSPSPPHHSGLVPP